MIRHSAIVAVVFLSVTTLFAAKETIEQLREQVAQAQLQDHPKLYTKIADLEFKEVNRLLDEGDTTGAQKVLNTLAEDCEKAAKASLSTRKHMKNTEISLRKISDGLDQIVKTIEYENRPPVQAAIDRIETVRNELLTAMFSK